MSNQKSKQIDLGKAGRGFYGAGLFIKFFFWFWFTVVLTGILVTAYGYLYHFLPESRKYLNMGREIFEENGQMLINAYETSGVEIALSVRLPGAFWLYDENLNIIFAPTQTYKSNRKKYYPSHYKKLLAIFTEKEEEVKETARRLLSGEVIENTELAGELLIGSALTSESGKRYVIISHFPQKHARTDRYLISRLTNTMPMFLLITAIFCYGLSRYMVGPIKELRQVSSDFACGKLSARVTGSATHRRDEIGDLALDFNTMADKIEQMICGQRRLFGDISHELRSPLARLQIASELLQKKLPQTEHQLLSRIDNEVARINALIEEVLQYSRLETGNIQGEQHQIDLVAVLQNICNDADFEGRTRNCKVSFNAPEKLEIVGIVSLIERAIENVLRNAIKYSPENSQVEVSLISQDNQALIRIADRGPGIPASEISKVFEPFYRCAEDRNRSSGGNGLGLAIAWHAVRLHNGNIELHNADGGGLIAEIKLPASKQPTKKNTATAG